MSVPVWVNEGCFLEGEGIEGGGHRSIPASELESVVVTVRTVTDPTPLCLGGGGGSTWETTYTV